MQPALSSLICRLLSRHDDVDGVVFELQVTGDVVVAFRRHSHRGYHHGSIIGRRRRRRRRRSVFVEVLVTVGPRRQERVALQVPEFRDLKAVAKPRRSRNTFRREKPSFARRRFLT